MTTPTIPIHDRMQLADQLTELGKLPSFFDFAHFLHDHGIKLESIITGSNFDMRELAMIRNNEIHTFRSFGLHEEIARWLRRWDSYDYSIPLTATEQAFLVARERWLVCAGWEADVPRDRWMELTRLVTVMGTAQAAVSMKQLFDDPDAPDTTKFLALIAPRCERTVAQLSGILGPPDRRFDSRRRKRSASQAATVSWW